MPTFEVEYRTGDVSTCHAKSHSAAKYQTFLNSDTGEPFADFMRWVRSVRKISDQRGAYQYINRTYSKAFEVGQRVIVPPEGQCAEVRGALVHPTSSTNYLNILMDGKGCTGLFHPANVQLEDTPND